MLKLTDPVCFSEEETSYINNTLKPLGKDGWYNRNPETLLIKGHISKHTIISQKGRCVYCERILARGEVQIEHVAHKGKYGCFTFEPFNLVSSCSCCNAPINKGQTDVISPPVNELHYESNHFNIIHPYFDDPDDHIKYFDSDRIFIDLNNCSEKGKETIRMFDWQSMWAVLKRSEIASMRHYSINALELANEIATYQIR